MVIYHARSTLGGRLQAKVATNQHKASPSKCEEVSIKLRDCVSFQMASMKMFQIQFHTGFVPRNAATVKFAKYVLEFANGHVS